MGDIFGADFLTNPKIASAETVDLNLPELSSIELPSFSMNNSSEAPRLVPAFSDVGQLKTSEGLENLNAEHFLSSSSSRKMSDENILKEKY